MAQNLSDTSYLGDLNQPQTLIAGVDEVGRGALFGAVVAATVVLPLAATSQLIELGVKDSKKLSSHKRNELVTPIKKVASGWGIGMASVSEIDELNILKASLLAMKRSIFEASSSPDICLIDGKFIIPQLPFRQVALIKGDSRSPAIAAASILAKVYRDEMIVQMAKQYPEYHLAKNKGYPTAEHRLAIQDYGISPEHRSTFKSCQSTLA